MVLHDHLQGVSVLPGFEPCAATCEHPSAPTDDVARIGPVQQQPNQHLQDDLGLGVSAHGSQDGTEVTVGPRHQRRREGMGRPPSRAVAGSVAGVQVEADAPVVQEHAETRKRQVAAEAVGVGLDQRHAHAVAVHGAHVHGVAVQPAVPERGCGARSDGRPAGVEEAIVHEGSAVGMLVQDGGPVVAGLPGRLHEEVGPERVVLRRQVQALDDPGRCQHQVPLGVGRNRPHVVSPDREAQWIHPVGTRRGEVPACVLAASDGEQFFAELPQVDAVASAVGEGTEHGRHTWPRDEGSGFGQPCEVPGAVHVPDPNGHACQEGRGGEALGGQADRGSQEVGQG